MNRPFESGFDLRLPGFKFFSGAALFACANLHPGVPARAQEALKTLGALADANIEAPLAPIAADASGGADRRPPPMIRTDKPAPVAVPLDRCSGKLQAKLDLNALHNGLWRTSLVVNLGGKPFWVSGQQSHEGNLHLVLTDQRSGKPVFLRDMDLILGHDDLNVGGQAYQITLKSNFMDLYGSQFVITEGSRVIAAFAIRDVMRAMYESGLQATLDGRTVRLQYTDQLFENSDGRVARYGDPLLVLMVEQAPGGYSGERNHYQGDATRAAQIVDTSLLRTSFKIAPYGLFQLDLKMTDATRSSLEIYSPGS